MIPPVDEGVLRDNPDFAVLYKQLTTVVLNPDGSTKDDAAAKEHQKIQEELRSHRLKAAKHHLLARAIASTSLPEPQAAATRPAAGRGIARASSFRPQQQPPRQQPSTAPQTQEPSLPEPLLDLLVILPPLLSAIDETCNSSESNPTRTPPLDDESLSLLLSSPPLSELETLLPDLAALVSSNLHSSALSLARVANPNTNPSYLHRHIPSLPATLAKLQKSADEARVSIAAARQRALSSLLTLLDTYTTALTALVRALEAKHGPIARSLDLRAEEVSLRARKTEAEVRLAAASIHRDVYPPEAVAALTNYATHLRDARVRAEERLKVRGAELAEYGVGVEGGAHKERTMREMARVHRDMMRQLEEAKGDLKRLEKS